jgi:hypothetical protein
MSPDAILAVIIALAAVLAMAAVCRRRRVSRLPVDMPDEPCQRDVYLDDVGRR